MFWLILTIVVALGGSAWNLYDEISFDKALYDHLFYNVKHIFKYIIQFIGLFLGLFLCAGMINGLVCAVISDSYCKSNLESIEIERYYELQDSNNIVALQDSIETNANLFIGSGHIGEENYYYYVEETNFGYKTNKLSVDSCFIKYINEEEKPKIERYSYVSDKKIHWFIIPNYKDRYVIYCPKGTISQEFKIDLK